MVLSLQVQLFPIQSTTK